MTKTHIGFERNQLSLFQDCRLVRFLPLCIQGGNLMYECEFQPCMHKMFLRSIERECDKHEIDMVESLIEDSSKVYFITAKDRTNEIKYIKIGLSKDPESRLMQLQCANPMKLDIYLWVPACYLSEKFIHNKFKYYKVSGEWFEPNNEILSYAKKIKATMQSCLGKHYV